MIYNPVDTTIYMYAGLSFIPLSLATYLGLQHFLIFIKIEVTKILPYVHSEI